MSGDELRRFASDLTNAGPRVKPIVDMAVQKTAADITRDAKLLAPVRTGNLRNSIGHTITRGSGYVEAEVGPTANYAYYVEYGTSKSRPKPFLGPATDRNLPKLEQALGIIAERTLG